MIKKIVTIVFVLCISVENSLVAKSITMPNIDFKTKKGFPILRTYKKSIGTIGLIMVVLYASSKPLKIIYKYDFDDAYQALLLTELKSLIDKSLTLDELKKSKDAFKRFGNDWVIDASGTLSIKQEEVLKAVVPFEKVRKEDIDVQPQEDFPYESLSNQDVLKKICDLIFIELKNNQDQGYLNGNKPFFVSAYEYQTDQKKAELAQVWGVMKKSEESEEYEGKNLEGIIFTWIKSERDRLKQSRWFTFKVLFHFIGTKIKKK